MTPLSKFVAGAGAIAALTLAAPATAQYYSPYGYGYSSPVTDVVNSVLGGYGYAGNQQIAMNACANAAQARIGAYGGGRVLGISGASPHGDGGVTVRGVATSGAYGYGYSYGYGAQARPDLTWRCRTDFRGFIRELSVNRAQSVYGYDNSTWDDDFSRFGYRRY